MAFLGQTYTTADLPQGQSYEAIPAGWYTVNITEAELKSTKDGGGQYIRIRYDIIGPSHQGRVVFGNVNLRNANPKAEEIGRQNLGDIARAIGLAQVSDTDQLIGGNLQIKVSIKTQDGYEPSNEVKAYKAVEGAGSTFAASMGSAPASPPPAASSSPPWMKKG